jgi:hypothetical protein
MICVILTAADDPKPLARLLTALVPAAADGLVREVAVVGADGPSRAIADDAGADCFETFAEAVADARSAWLAGLPPTATLTPDWMAIVADHLARDLAAPARLVARPAGLRFGAAPEGWLVPKRLTALAGAVEQDLQRLARRGGRRLRILDRR